MRFGFRLKTVAMFVVIHIAITANLLASETLKRRASWQAKFEPQQDAGVKIAKLDMDSPMHRAGLKVGDTLLAVNGTPIIAAEQWGGIRRALVADQPYAIRYRRGSKLALVSVQFAPEPKETYANTDVIYDTVLNDYGIRQRVIITRPKSKFQSLPAIFLLQGLSCSSIEYTPGRKSNFIRSLRNIVTGSGMVMMRVEKPGMGDSEGHCSKTDFKTELNSYRVAVEYLKTLPYVDAKRIVVYGSSMGSALAPYIAEAHKLNGVIADGTFYRTWFEHMLEIERRIKTMQGLSQREVNQQINHAYIPLYYGMLIQKKSYGELIQHNPLLAEYNYHGLDHMYGRPVKYYHQVQDFNFADAWDSITVPVRIRWGTNDWIMSEYDIDIIDEVLESAGHKNVKIYKYPGLDHWDTVHKTAKNSFEGKPGKWEDKISDQIISWAKEINSRAWRE